MAERIIANLTLDTYQRNKIPPLVIPQHDYGARYIRVRITEQGENVSVASGSVVSIIAKRMADGQSAAFSGSVNADGSVLVPVTQWMLDAPSDDVDCHVAVTGTGYQYSTTSFVISPQERENPSYLEEDDPRVNIVEEALIKVVEEADRAEEQANLAASNARAEVERLVGELGVVQETGVSITSVMSQGASSRSFANAIKGEESGGAVLCEEVSPVLHPVVVGVRSRNLIPYPHYDTTKTANGITFTDNGDGTTTANGTATADVNYWLMYEAQMPAGSYFVSGTPSVTNYGARIVAHYANADGTPFYLNVYSGDEGKVLPIPPNTALFLYIRIDSGTTITNGVFKPMLNIGSTAEPYTPFVPNGTAVKVTSSNRNMLGGIALANRIKEVDSGALINTADKTVLYSSAGISDKVLFTNFKPNTQYTLIFKGYTNVGFLNLVVHYTDGTRGDFERFAESNKVETIIFVSDESKSIKSLAGVWYDGNTTLYYDGCGIFEGVLTEGDFGPFEGQTIDTTVGSTIDLPSIAPYMSVYTNTEGTVVDVTYVKDTNAVVQKLVNAIVALGGNV